MQHKETETWVEWKLISPNQAATWRNKPTDSVTSVFYPEDEGGRFL
jgi:hypothetical protein